jgi:hypothetical protein
MKTLARARDRAELLERLTGLRADSAPRWGQMTAPQMVCHLSDAFRMALGEKTVSEASSLLERTLVKWIALYAPLRWPSGIRTRPEIEQGRGGTCPSDFAADVAEAARLMETFAAHALAADPPSHPIFGKLSRRAWLRWAYLHTDHHLRQFGA